MENWSEIAESVRADKDLSSGGSRLVDNFLEWFRALWPLLAAFGSFIAFSTYRIITYGSRIAMLEQAVSKLPESIEELKALLAELRKEGSERAEKIYARMDDLRKELKADIIRETDRRN